MTLYKVLLTFEHVVKMLKCDYIAAVLSGGAVYYALPDGYNL